MLHSSHSFTTSPSSPVPSTLTPVVSSKADIAGPFFDDFVRSQLVAQTPRILQSLGLLHT